jgi:hypothetical protein
MFEIKKTLRNEHFCCCSVQKNYMPPHDESSGSIEANDLNEAYTHAILYSDEEKKTKQKQTT